MLFKVMVVEKAPVVVKQKNGGGSVTSKTTYIPPGTMLEVYGYANSEQTRFVAWNEQWSSTFFTVSITDCRPAY